MRMEIIIVSRVINCIQGQIGKCSRINSGFLGVERDSAAFLYNISYA